LEIYSVCRYPEVIYVLGSDSEAGHEIVNENMLYTKQMPLVGWIVVSGRQ